MANTNNVIHYIRQKAINGFDEPITYLGTEPRFISPIINSTANNFEEQYILGADTYVEVYTDNNNNTVIEKSFHKNSNEANTIYTDYYKVKTTVYDEGAQRDFYFSGNQFIVADEVDAMVFGDGSLSYPNLNTLYAIDDGGMFSFDGETFNINATLNDLIIRQDELFFVSSNGTVETPILTKRIYKKYINENNNAKVIFKEIIENHLASQKNERS